MSDEVDAAVARAVVPLQERIAQLESQVDWLFAQLGQQAPNGTMDAPAQQQWPYPVSPEVVDLLRAGRDIEAIKRVRTETGLGLAEAKRLADQVREQLAHG